MSKGHVKLSPYYPPPGSVASGAAGSVLNAVSATAGNLVTAGTVPVAVFGPYSSVITRSVLQHSGFYWIIAAKCAVERMARYTAQKSGENVESYHDGKVLV